jgi:hypothetical protein
MQSELKFFLFVASLFLGTVALAENPPVHAILPNGIPGDSELVWNKWDTKNFIILSLDKSQGLDLKWDADKIMSETLSRWGVEGGLSSPCKIVCVTNRETLKKLFGIDAPQSEVRRDADGKISVNAIWLDYQSLSELPTLISSSYLSASDLSFFVQRGVSRLGAPAAKIKSEVSGLGEFSSKDVFSLSREKWLSMNPDARESFDRKSELVCLLLRKEMGKQRFSEFLRAGKQDEQSLRSVYGFDGFDEFDSTLNRYSENLTKDASEGILPEEYLTVR